MNNHIRKIKVKWLCSLCIEEEKLKESHWSFDKWILKRKFAWSRFYMYFRGKSHRVRKCCVLWSQNFWYKCPMVSFERRATHSKKKIVWQDAADHNFLDLQQNPKYYDLSMCVIYFILSTSFFFLTANDFRKKKKNTANDFRKKKITQQSF